MYDPPTAAARHIAPRKQSAKKIRKRSASSRSYPPTHNVKKEGCAFFDTAPLDFFAQKLILKRLSLKR